MGLPSSGGKKKEAKPANDKKDKKDKKAAAKKSAPKKEKDNRPLGQRLGFEVANEDGVKQCTVNCVDLVEDRVRHRTTALALLFALFAPILTYILVGDLNAAWNRNDDLLPPPDTSLPNATTFYGQVTGLMTSACIAEQSCFAGASWQNCTATACLTLLLDSDSPLWLRLRPEVGVSTALNFNGSATGTNGTAASTSTAPAAPAVAPTDANATGGDAAAAPGGNGTASAATSPPPPPASNATGSASTTTTLSDGGTWLGVIFFTFFAIVALFGNSPWHSIKWLYFGWLLSLIAFICIPIIIRPQSPLWLFWWGSTLVALVAFTRVVLGLWYAKKGRDPPKFVGDAAKYSFDDARSKSYAAYCKAMLSHPGSRAARQLRKGMASGEMTHRQQAELQTAMKAYDDARFGFHHQFRCIAPWMPLPKVCMPRKADTAADDPANDVANYDDAVHLPLRLQLACVVSMYAVLLACNTWIRYGIDLARRIHAVETKYLQPTKAAVDGVARAVEAATGVPMPTTEAAAYLEWFAFHFHSFGVACESAGTSGGLLGFVMVMCCLLLLLLDFRANVLRARQGLLAFPPGSVATTSHAWGFVGGAVASSIFSFGFVAVVIGLLFFCISWSMFWELLGWLLANYWGLILFLVLVWAANTFGRQIVRRKVGAGRVITSRFWWMAYDVWMLVAELIGGIANAVLRVLTGVCALLVAALRLDRTIYPAWVEGFVLHDKLLRNYRALIYLYHAHNNPVVHTFVSLIATDAKARRDAQAARQSAPTSYEANQDLIEGGSRRQLVVNRWRKWRFMVANPSVGKARESMLIQAALDPDSIGLEFGIPGVGGGGGGSSAARGSSAVRGPAASRGAPGGGSRDPLALSLPPFAGERGIDDMGGGGGAADVSPSSGNPIQPPIPAYSNPGPGDDVDYGGNFTPRTAPSLGGQQEEEEGDDEEGGAGAVSSTPDGSAHLRTPTSAAASGTSGRRRGGSLSAASVPPAAAPADDDAATEYADGHLRRLHAELERQTQAARPIGTTPGGTHNNPSASSPGSSASASPPTSPSSTIAERRAARLAARGEAPAALTQDVDSPPPSRPSPRANNTPGIGGDFVPPDTPGAPAEVVGGMAPSPSPVSPASSDESSHLSSPIRATPSARAARGGAASGTRIRRCRDATPPATAPAAVPEEEEMHDEYAGEGYGGEDYGGQLPPRPEETAAHHPTPSGVARARAAAAARANAEVSSGAVTLGNPAYAPSLDREDSDSGYDELGT